MKQERSSFEKKEAPMTKVGSSIAETSEQGQATLNEGYVEGEMLSISKTLVTLPSFLGHQEFNSEIVPLPVTNGDKNPKTLDSMAQGIMQQTFNIPMNLEEIRDCKTFLWEKLLDKWGVRKQLLKETLPSKELCKVSTYAKAEGDKGNTTLKVKKDSHLNQAILDTGAWVSIVTKETWIKWGKRALTSTRMGLQLADG